MVIIRYRKITQFDRGRAYEYQKKVIGRENCQLGRQMTTHVTGKFYETSIEELTITVEIRNIAINAEYLFLRRVQPIFLPCLVLFLQIYFVSK